MRFANKVKKPFVYTPASVMINDTEYLKKKFTAIRKQQAEEKKIEEAKPKLRKVK